MWSQPNPFSIVLCTYNGEKYLDEQLCSLREQAGVAEIVVTDDRSTDRTPAILRRHAAEDPRIRVRVNPRTLGVTGNFQQAIGLATSPWIALADQDDVWLAGKLARMRACWDGRSGLMHHASLKFHGTVPRAARHIAHDRRKFRGVDWRRLLYRNSVVGHTAVFRRDLAGKLMPFPAGLPHDWWIGVGAAVHGEVQFLDEYLVLYRIHERNTYHAAGSRLRRMREEHGMRVGMLRALAGAKHWPVRGRGFADDYLALLRSVAAGEFPWRLWLFYLRNAPLLFAGAGGGRSRITYLRRSLAAALTAMISPVPAGEEAREISGVFR
jgi:glycosyltransferase involved in cell wall biosynthesis